MTNNEKKAIAEVVEKQMARYFESAMNYEKVKDKDDNDEEKSRLYGLMLAELTRTDGQVRLLKALNVTPDDVIAWKHLQGNDIEIVN